VVELVVEAPVVAVAGVAVPVFVTFHTTPVCAYPQGVGIGNGVPFGIVFLTSTFPVLIIYNAFSLSLNFTPIGLKLGSGDFRDTKSPITPVPRLIVTTFCPIIIF
jgi:hypothetical protein